jgi:alcohol dehydrogenase (NADP+)
MVSNTSPMTTFTLPSGNLMPGLGLGTWKSDPGVVGAAIKSAIDSGYRHLDCAAIYGNEKEIGSALTAVFDSASVERKDLFITSKLWNTMHLPDDVEPALQQTLADLGCDYLDLYLMHWPVAMDKNDKSYIPLDIIPLAKTWEAMELCKEKGLVKDIGVSNFSVKKLKELMETCKIKPAVNQVERHPYLQNPELLEFCKDNNILLTAYSPLGSPDRPDGLKSATETSVLNDSVIIKIAEKHQATPAQVLLQWALASGTSVIPKSVSVSRQMENLDAATKIVLDEDDMNQILVIDKHWRYVDGSFWCGEGSPHTIETLWDEAHLVVTTDEL